MNYFGERGLRPTWMEVDLDALEHNYILIRERAGDGRGICAVVKADAYGHGAVAVARRLEGLGCDYFGVALVEEGLQLREAGIRKPILLIGAVYGEEGIFRAAAAGIDVSVHSLDLLPLVARAAERLKRDVRCHLKVDTGMGRLGVPPGDVESWCEEAARGGVELVGVFTNFASADNRADPGSVNQYKLFLEAVEAVRGHGFDPPLLHVANSGAILNFPRTFLTMIRPGLLLYGLPPAPQLGDGSFRPVAALRTRIVQLGTYPKGHRFGYSGRFEAQRPIRAAVLAIGYGDGVNRQLSNNGYVLVRGRRAPIIGRISMDLTAVDVTEVPGAALGDVATVFGRDGSEEINVWEVAQRIGTVPWEVFCCIGGRVPRVALGDGGPAAAQGTVNAKSDLVQA